jgi:hypothetical protein
MVKRPGQSLLVGDAAVEESRVLLGSSLLVLLVLLTAIGEGHGGAPQVSPGPRSMAWIELRPAGAG